MYICVYVCLGTKSYFVMFKYLTLSLSLSLFLSLSLSLYIYIYIYQSLNLDQSAGAVENIDCLSAGGKTSKPHACPDMTRNNMMVRFQ